MRLRPVLRRKGELKKDGTKERLEGRWTAVFEKGGYIERFVEVFGAVLLAAEISDAAQDGR